PHRPRAPRPLPHRPDHRRRRHGLVPRGQLRAGDDRDLHRAARRPGRRARPRGGLRAPGPARDRPLRSRRPARLTPTRTPPYDPPPAAWPLTAEVPMPLDLPYRTTILTALGWFKVMGFRFQISGQEQVPRRGGAVLAINHISYIDFIMAGLGAHPSRRLVRFMAKRETFDHPITGPLMRSYRHISVDRADGIASYRSAIDNLRRGEVVGVFP